MSDANADFWTARWRRLLLPPADAEQRAQRLDRELDRFRRLQEDIAVIESELERLLAQSPGQILTTLPGVATNRAAAFSAHTLPIERWPSAGHLYSATGLGPAAYESSTISRRGRISRQGLPEHRDALMGIAWGLSQRNPRSPSETPSSGPGPFGRSRLSRGGREWQSYGSATPRGAGGKAAGSRRCSRARQRPRERQRR